MSSAGSNPVFRWPPNAAPTETPSPRVTGPAAGAPISRASPSLVERASKWWGMFERAWLDPVALPLRRRAIEASWAPDSLEAFCPRCGRDTGPHECDADGCSVCRDRRLPWDRIVRLGAYVPPLSEWVCEVKFTRAAVLGLEMGRMLGRQIRAAAAFGPGKPGAAPMVVVPVPSTLRRRLARGIDHSSVIARGIASELNAPVISRALWRTHRPSQRSVEFSGRAANVSRSIRVAASARKRLAGRWIVLVDDVSTSGATLRAAARAIREAARTGGPGSAPLALWACVVAVTPGRRHAPMGA